MANPVPECGQFESDDVMDDIAEEYHPGVVKSFKSAPFSIAVYLVLLFTHTRRTM